MVWLPVLCRTISHGSICLKFKSGCITIWLRTKNIYGYTLRNFNVTSLISDTDAINIQMWKLISCIYRVYNIWSLVNCNRLSDGHCTRLENCISELSIDFHGRYMGNLKRANYAVWCTSIFEIIVVEFENGNATCSEHLISRQKLFWHPDSHYLLIWTNLPCNGCNMQIMIDFPAVFWSVLFSKVRQTKVVGSPSATRDLLLR